MIVREADALRLNAILNHPKVLPTVTENGESEIDATPLVGDEQNYCLMDEDGQGGLLFIAKYAGLYEVHTQFMPETGPRRAVRIMNECLDYMFSKTDMMELWSKVPLSNTPARHLAELAGAKLNFVRVNGWAKQVDLQYYRLLYGDWVVASSSCRKLGETFHARLDSVLGHETHEEDSTHNQWVGATTMALYGGQAGKGVIFYNRWATIAGYRPIRLVAHEPVVLDIGTAYLIQRENDFDIVRK